MTADRQLAIVGMAWREPIMPAIFTTAQGDLIAAALEDAGIAIGESPSLTSLPDAIESLGSGRTDRAIVGDGTSALVLKRRDHAERDGDRIYALILGRVDDTAINDVPVIVGTGLSVWIRAALSLFHRAHPTDLDAARPWIHAGHSPRRVQVEGSILLEEHADSADGLQPGALIRWDSEAILLSAPDRVRLAERVRSICDWLRGHPCVSLKDIACTLNCTDGKRQDGIRLGLVAASVEDLSEKLAAILGRLEDVSKPTIGDGRIVYHWDNPLGRTGGLAFLFPGEGSQYPGMLADLCLHFPEVRRQFDVADRIAVDQDDAVRPSEQLFGGEALWTATTAVNLILNAQWAIYQLLARLGLVPDAVAGHSSGEILALAAAGVLQADEQLERQLGRLGAIFRGLETAGEMPEARLVAIAADRDRAEAACRAVGADRVAVAIDNCPHQVVLAGPAEDVDRVVDHLRAANILVEVLPFDRPYHTPEFAAVSGPIAESFARLTFREPRLPVYSCASRARMPDDPESIRLLAVSQWTRTVAFRETVEAMHADGLRVFVDVGARGNLAGFVQDILRGRPAFAIAANLPRRSGTTQLNHLVASLFAQGIDVRPWFLYARRRPRRIEELMESPARSIPPLNEPLSFDSECPPSIEPAVHPRPMIETATLPLGTRFRFLVEEEIASTPSTDVDSTMLAFQETMRAFLETQRTVLGAYLGEPIESDETNPISEPGPWLGEISRLVPGSEVQSIYVLDVRRDPIAEHHTLGGRKVSAIDPSLRGLPVLPFAVMAEMAAQAAAMIVSPDLALVRLIHVKANKWVRYENEPVFVEIRAWREASDDPGEERVRISLYNRGRGGRSEASRPVFEATAAFGLATPEPPLAEPWVLEKARVSRFTAASIYDEQWLFHGPAMQAVSEVGPISASGIEGKLRVLPWEPLIDPDCGRPARLHTDAIVLDSFTHLLGCWGLDELADRGDVVFPLHLDDLQIFGDRPDVGTDIACRIAIRELQRHRLRVDVEIVRPDGTVWMRLRDWEDWRFHWPGRYRDVFRQPRDFFIGEEWSLEGAGPGLRAVWLAPPADMGRPVWRDVLEQTQLGPAELAAHLAEGGSEDLRSQRVWGRIAAKEATRRLWLDQGWAPTYPADLAVIEEGKRFVLIHVEQPGDRSLPSIAIADADGVAVALASIDPRMRLGVAVDTIAERDEWSARRACARMAASQAIGSPSIEIVGHDLSAGLVLARTSDCHAVTFRIPTGRRGEHVWAWIAIEGTEP